MAGPGDEPSLKPHGRWGAAPLPWPLLLIGSAWLLIAGLGAVTGLFTLDELIYVAAAEAFASDLSLLVKNGYEEFGARGLRLWFLIPTEDQTGLTAQYPSGHAIVAAPFLLLMGVRGLFLMNALAAVGVLMLTYWLARRLYGDRALALTAALLLGVATYLPEYALGIWPHALAGLAVLGTTCCTVNAVLGKPETSVRWALMAGLALGFAVNIRVDAVLIGPPLGLWALLFAQRPFGLAVPALLGLAPGFGLAMALNAAKFGVVSPISYGSPGGSADPLTYLALGGVLAGGLVLVVGLRTLSKRVALWQIALGLGLAGVAALLTSETLRSALAAQLHGLHVLVFDMRASTDMRPGVLRDADGGVSFWGVPKKALAQSLPWIGLLVLLALRRPDRRIWAGHVLCLFAVLLWLPAYLRSEWHGGFGANMRYFIPILPFLAILGAAAMREAARLAGDGQSLAQPASIGLGVGLLALATVAATATGTSPLVFLQHELSLGLTLVLTVATLLAALAPKPATAFLLRVCLFAAIALSVVLGSLLDPAQSQLRRAGMATLGAQFETALAPVEGKALVYANFVEPFAFVLRDEDTHLALIELNPDNAIDPKLITSALDKGYRVFGHAHLRNWVSAALPELTATHLPTTGDHGLWEFSR
ncbi:MAG: glycosyltransferase family 39 protein [Pseudomonadota bacterium]